MWLPPVFFRHISFWSQRVGTPWLSHLYPIMVSIMGRLQWVMLLLRDNQGLGGKSSILHTFCNLVSLIFKPDFWPDKHSFELQSSIQCVPSKFYNKDKFTKKNTFSDFCLGLIFTAYFCLSIFF